MTDSLKARQASGRLANYSLVNALLNRRSRRFGKGMELKSGPLAYASQDLPEPLTLEEEAALTFAACGITGPILAELPFGSEDPAQSHGNIVMNLFGRTVACGDASHATVVFVMNDDGCWMMKRPRDYETAELPGLVNAAREHRWVELYERGRVRIADRRIDVPREPPYVPPFNSWSANLPGTTYFLPFAEMTGFYINVLLAAFSEEFGNYVIDERNSFQPAGLAKFTKSKGGHLNDDLNSGKVGMLGYVDDWLLEFVALEQGGMLQNLGLMCEALGIGGFSHFAAYPAVWFERLGFRMEYPAFSRTSGVGPLLKVALHLLKRDLPVPVPVGLERDGEVLIKPFCPPYYRTMEEAVLAFIDTKYAPGKGIFRDGGRSSAWSDPGTVQAAIAPYSDKAISATIACCEYSYNRYGRIPPGLGPFRSVLAFQAARLDRGFYDRFYRTENIVHPREEDQP